MVDHNGEVSKSGVLTVVAEEGAAAVPGALVAALAGDPVLAVAGAVGGVMVKGIIAGVRGALSRSLARRQDAFEQALEAELGGEDEAALVRLLNENEPFAEVVFQNFRRAIDALDPSVVPVIAKLTSHYKGRKPDGFLKSLGAVLQEVDAAELVALRQMASAADHVCTQFATTVAEITPFTRDGVSQATFVNPLARERSETEGFVGPLPQGALRALSLMQRHGLTLGVDDGGADLAMTNRLEFDAQTCARLVAVVGRQLPEVKLLHADFFTTRSGVDEVLR